MNTETSSSSTLVWDLPVRLFHWLLVACFAGTGSHLRQRALATRTCGSATP